MAQDDLRDRLVTDRVVATVAITIAAVVAAAAVAGLTWLAELVRAGIAVLSVFGGGVA